MCSCNIKIATCSGKLICSQMLVRMQHIACVVNLRLLTSHANMVQPDQSGAGPEVWVEPLQDTKICSARSQDSFICHFIWKNTWLCTSLGSCLSTVQPTDLHVPKISFTVPFNSLAQLRSRMTRAISITSSRARLPLCLMFFSYKTKTMLASNRNKSARLISHQMLCRAPNHASLLDLNNNLIMEWFWA